MANSCGKIFENDFKKSIPEDVFYLRLKDSGGFGNSEATRFSSFNIADCIVYDGNNLFILELKSHQGKSLPLSCIREKQIEGLFSAGNFLNIVSGIIVNFRDVEQTYFLNVEGLIKFMGTSERKSIPLDYFREHGVIIHQVKKKVHYTYLLNIFLDGYKLKPIGKDF
jgi:recombination protein U